MIVELNDTEAQLITVAMAIASSLSLLAGIGTDSATKAEIKRFIVQDAIPAFDRLMDSMTDKENEAMTRKFPDVNPTVILAGSN